MHGGSTEDGAIWNCGFGDEGRLGHGNEQDRLRPTRLGPEVFGGLPVSCLTWR
jgi:alpha-tubulin suppressor-like RCC1 family protein